jgi:transposase
MSRVDDRAVFTEIVFVLTSGCAWRHLPPSFGVTVPTAHRRFTEWMAAGLRRNLHRAVLDKLGSQGMIDWSGRSSTEHPSGPKTGRTDRTEPGRPRQTRLEDPCAVRPDRPAPDRRHLRGQHPRQPRTQTPGQRNPRRPLPPRTTAQETGQAARRQGLRHPRPADWLRQHRIIPRIARKGIEPGDKLGKHRWVIERTMCAAKAACRIPGSAGRNLEGGSWVEWLT